MAIGDDWNIDYATERIDHVDGILTYGSMDAGTAPVLFEWIRGATSGAIAQVVAGSDLGGTSTTGTLSLSNTVGIFSSTEAIRVLDELTFDTVTNNGFGKSYGGVFTTAVPINADGGSEDMDVYSIEYNLPTDTDGDGTAYGIINTTGFGDDEVIDITGGQATIALVRGAGAETDNSAKMDGGTATVTGDGIDVAGTSNTNDSVIIHYDAGSQLIPEGAKIEDATTNAFGFAQQIYGVAATGSVRLVDSDTTGGAWTNDNALQILDVVNYDTLTAGKVFSVGDVIVGSVSAATGRVLLVIDDGDSSGRLILASETGTWNAAAPDLIQVDSITIAEVENTTFTLAAATLELANEGIINEQRPSQGGLFNASFYSTIIIDALDELDQLDDTMPLRGDVKDQLYTILGTWYISDLSFRFIESGSFTDALGANIWTNLQTLGTIADVANHGFNYATATPTPQPNLYVEQDGR